MAAAAGLDFKKDCACFALFMRSSYLIITAKFRDLSRKWYQTYRQFKTFNMTAATIMDFVNFGSRQFLHSGVSFELRF
jgi:hypothetical protein